MRFVDRAHAGAALGEALSELSPTDPLVLALPRGGLPVAALVARALGCQLDVLVVRKLGVPYQPELAMGALGEGGVLVRSDEIVELAGIRPQTFDDVVSREKAELERRLEMYRAGVPPAAVAGTTAIIVDDGLATGSTARAAVAVVRAKSPDSVWVAAPVAPADTVRMLETEADRVVVLHIPVYFGAVGMWYDDFTQVTDYEVRDYLTT